MNDRVTRKYMDFFGLITEFTITLLTLSLRYSLRGTLKSKSESKKNTRTFGSTDAIPPI